MNDVSVFINCLGSENIRVEVDLSVVTIGEIMFTVHMQTQIPVHVFWLQHNGRHLHANHTLNHCNIHKDSTLIVVGRLRGGVNRGRGHGRGTGGRGRSGPSVTILSQPVNPDQPAQRIAADIKCATCDAKLSYGIGAVECPICHQYLCCNDLLCRQTHDDDAHHIPSSRDVVNLTNDDAVQTERDSRTAPVAQIEAQAPLSPWSVRPNWNELEKRKAGRPLGSVNKKNRPRILLPTRPLELAATTINSTSTASLPDSSIGATEITPQATARKILDSLLSEGYESRGLQVREHEGCLWCIYCRSPISAIATLEKWNVKRHFSGPRHSKNKDEFDSRRIVEAQVHCYHTVSKCVPRQSLLSSG